MSWPFGAKLELFTYLNKLDKPPEVNKLNDTNKIIEAIVRIIAKNQKRYPDRITLSFFSLYLLMINRRVRIKSKINIGAKNITTTTPQKFGLSFRLCHCIHELKF